MVEDDAADGDFRLLSFKRPSPQTPPDDGLASSDGSLGRRAPSVAGEGLPLHPAVFDYYSDMLIPLAGRLIAARFDRVDARRNDDGSIGAMADDRVAGGLSIIGAIGGTVRLDRRSDREVIPALNDQNSFAHFRRPMDMMRHG